MSYPTVVSDVSYNHRDIPYDIRIRDCYVDRNFYGPSLSDDGFSAILSNEVDITDGYTLVPFNTISQLVGGYNGGMFNTTNSIATIQRSGIYSIVAKVGYIHDFNTNVESITVSIRKNGASPFGQLLAYTTLFYASDSNDEESILCNNIVYLLSGETVGVYIQCPLSSNQKIASLSTFACQRIA